MNQIDNTRGIHFVLHCWSLSLYFLIPERLIAVGSFLVDKASWNLLEP